MVSVNFRISLFGHLIKITGVLSFRCIVLDNSCASKKFKYAFSAFEFIKFPQWEIYSLEFLVLVVNFWSTDVNYTIPLMILKQKYIRYLTANLLLV